MKTEEVIDALRSRHPSATVGSYVGQWVTIREWRGIDLLALDAWRGAAVVGYEVKVSRSDMRKELLRPWKRAEAVAMTTEFYFAIPAGLLTPAEIAYIEPEWEDGDFDRKPCPGLPARRINEKRGHWGEMGGVCRKVRGGSRRWYTSSKTPTGYLVRLPVPRVLHPRTTSYVDGVAVPPVLKDYETDDLVSEQGFEMAKCPVCGGSGHVGLSRVEREAPTLWVPRDVGLVVIDGRGCTVVKRSPKRKDPEPIAKTRQQVNDLVRWTSHRPDPRHRL